MDKQMLQKLVEEGKSSREIARETNKSQTTIAYWLGKYKLETRAKTTRKRFTSREERKEEARRKAKIYYQSDKWPKVNCVGCGKEKKRRKRGTKDEFCADCWRHHIKSTKSRTGYQYVVPINHFGKLDAAGKIPTHRFVAELVLERNLEKHETIHHIDNNSFNNEPWNLCVLSKANHASYHNWIRQSFVMECSEETLKRFAEGKENIYFLKDLTVSTLNSLLENRIKIKKTRAGTRARRKKPFAGGLNNLIRGQYNP